jgi:iron complex transport system substrate-binding protein
LTREKILSLNPCTDAILAEVADRDQIAALSHYSSSPEQSSMDVGLARSLPSTGGTVEEVLALHPSVVVSGNMTPPATRVALQRMGVRLVEVPMASTLAQSRQQVLMLAQLAGHRDRGAALIARMDAALAKATPPAGAKPISALIWQSGGMVPGRDTLIAQLLTRTGFRNFSADQGMKQADILPLELVLAHPPQVIFRASRWPKTGQGEENRMMAHPALAGLKGVQRFNLDPALEWCGGPTIIRAANRLAEVRAIIGHAPPPTVIGVTRLQSPPKGAGAL